MKKILSLLLILAMLTVAMVSCKKDEPTETPVTPDPPVQETRYTITAEEWAAVCALTNFTATQAGSAVYTSGDVTETEETFAEYKYTATATYHKVQETGDPIYEEYYALIDGRILNIRLLSSGAFEADVTDRTELDNFAEAFEFDGVTFDTLTYNAEAKAYVLDLSDEDMEMKYTFYFENGQIVKFVAYATYGEHGYSAVMNIEVAISNIGTTAVTVPEYTMGK